MTPVRRDSLRTAPEQYRASPARGTAQTRVERDGGDFGGGLIRNVSLITRGEAIGHGRWIDGEMLDAVAAAAKALKSGVKSRFTHPGLSSDGLGKFLGRAKNVRVTGDQVLGDLHLAESSHDTPDGDLGEYVMHLAEEDPQALAISIVFWPDRGAEDRHRVANSDEDGKFHSPDASNKKNLPHARLSKLDAADVVDEPAANPDGLFHRGDAIPREATALLEYALCGGDPPETAALGIDPERARAYILRTLQARPDLQCKLSEIFATDAAGEGPADSEGPESAAGNSPAHEEPAMANEQKGGTAPTPAAAPTQNSTPATFADLKAAFPNANAEFREKCLEGGLSLDAAKNAYIASIEGQRAELTGTITHLRGELDAANKRAVEAEARASQISTSGTAAATPADKGAAFADNPEGWKSQYAASEKLQQEFTSEKGYVAFREAEKAGRVKIG